MDDNTFVTQLASRLNQEFDLPVFSEATEQSGLETLLTFMLPLIPPYVRQPMLDASDGLTDREIQFWVDVITKWFVEEDLTLLPEFMEDPIFQTAIPAIAKTVLSLARKGLSLDQPEPI